jgi:SAM-dependent methyltransferase
MIDLLSRLDVFRCPECHASIRVDSEGIQCQHCLAKFPIENGIPLFSVSAIRQKGTGTTPEKKSLSSIKSKYPFLAKLPMLIKTPSLEALTRGRDRLRTYLDQFSGANDAVIVDVGAGCKRYANVIALDLYNYPGIDLCSHAHKLPFKDNSVDMVISTSAIEHMLECSLVLAEMGRVLKPGGVIFMTAPFIYPYHPEPFDLHRWSADGLKREMPGFICLESGGVRGPHDTLYTVLSAYFSWMFSFGMYPLYLFNSLIFNWVFFPLQILEALRGRFRKQTPLDSIVYFVGRKQ